MTEISPQHCSVFQGLVPIWCTLSILTEGNPSKSAKSSIQSRSVWAMSHKVVLVNCPIKNVRSPALIFKKVNLIFQIHHLFLDLCKLSDMTRVLTCKGRGSTCWALPTLTATYLSCSLRFSGVDLVMDKSETRANLVVCHFMFLMHFEDPFVNVFNQMNLHLVNALISTWKDHKWWFLDTGHHESWTGHMMQCLVISILLALACAPELDWSEFRSRIEPNLEADGQNHPEMAEGQTGMGKVA